MGVIKTNKGINGIIVIQTNFWNKRLLAFIAGQQLLSEQIHNQHFIAGLMLYWAEGSKTLVTAISNSDPNLIALVVVWFRQFFNILPDSLVVQMHIHSGQNEPNLRQYWSRVTKIPVANFQRSYIKPVGTGHRRKKLYKGTVKIRVKGQGSTYLLYKIFGAIAEYNKRTLGSEIQIEDWISKPKYSS